MSGKQHRKKPRSNSRAPRKLKEFSENTPVADALDNLLVSRYHGAVNIRGIRFQLRYSVLRAVQLAVEARADGFEKQAGTLQFEGIEDVDIKKLPSLKPLHVARQDTEQHEFIQVKTSAGGWSWSNLGDPLFGFIEAFRTRVPGLKLRLVTDFAFTGDLLRLQHFANSPQASQDEIQGKFVKLVQTLGGTKAEADALLPLLVLESLPEPELRSNLNRVIAELTGATDQNAVEGYELLLSGRALAWAAERAVVRGSDVNDVLRGLDEALARSAHYAAVAHRWVGPIEYAPDAVPDDFFAGKGTRIGHVVSGLDVRRPRWLERINQVYESTAVCIIRAPSGHGKSTLAYRYAVEHWPAVETIVVRSAESAEETNAIADYLKFRASLGLRVRVLIDADYRTRFWPRVAQSAIAVGAHVLVTVRTEDWQRFALDSLTKREILEPSLEIEEARDVFSEFSKRGLVHHTVVSAGWAYERMRAPQLLLEYVYFITHGQMLEDRLRDQVRSFRELNEDPAKKQLLRLASLANALGTSVEVRRILEFVQLRDDVQDVLGSIVGEYVTLSHGKLESLHWIRSEHLAKILHEGGIPSVTETVLSLLRIVPEESLGFFVSNAFRWNDIDRVAFLAGLVEHSSRAELSVLLSIVDGIFEAGERDYFMANRGVFEKAAELSGPSGVFMLSADTSPTERTNVIARMAEIVGEVGHLPDLRNLLNQIQEQPRGFDLVRSFLDRAVNENSERLIGDGSTGQLLDWCALADVTIRDWGTQRHKVVEDRRVFELPVEHAASLSQGLFRYDREAFDSWYRTHKDDLLPYLQLHTLTLTLNVIEPSSVVELELADPRIEAPAAPNEAEPADRAPSADDVQRARADAERNGTPTADVRITFLVNPFEVDRGNDLSVSKLELLRRTLPFCGRYFGNGEYFMPEGLEMPHDQTVKAIPRWNLPYPSDVSKNVVFRRITESEFAPDTYYGMQEAWYEARRLALKLVSGWCTLFESALAGKRVDVERLFGNDMAVLRAFETAMKNRPDLSETMLARLGQVPAPLRAALSSKDWGDALGSVQNFTQPASNYISEHTEQSARLAGYAAREAIDSLPKMHQIFDAMFLDSPDYFDAKQLNASETEAYRKLDLLVDGYIREPLGRIVDSPTKVLKDLRVQKDSRDIARIADALADAGLPGDVVLGTAISESRHTRAFAIGVPVENAEVPQGDLIKAAQALSGVADVADVFWLIPLYDGNRTTPKGYYLSSRLLRDDWGERDAVSAAYSLLFPVEIPGPVAGSFPTIPFREAKPSLSRWLTGLRAEGLAQLQRRNAISHIGRERDHRFLAELRNKLTDALTNVHDALRPALAEIEARIRVNHESPEAAIAATEIQGFLTLILRLFASEEIAGDVLERWSNDTLTQLAEQVEAAR